MSNAAFTREELADYFRALLEYTNSECNKVSYALAALDVEYEGALMRGGEAPLLLAEQDGVRLKFSFKPVIKIKEGEANG
ncbi:MAG: hypothetical protein LBP91_03765 [Coriobacteriales bacterium]|jgi:hypothetical protein|nr:hypothetical protein [Coriobacteriales bacterium]